MNLRRFYVHLFIMRNAHCTKVLELIVNASVARSATTTERVIPLPPAAFVMIFQTSKIQRCIEHQPYYVRSYGWFMFYVPMKHSHRRR